MDQETKDIQQGIDSVTAPMRRPHPDTPDWFAEQPGELLTDTDIATAVRAADLAGIRDIQPTGEGTRFIRTDGASLTLQIDHAADNRIDGEYVDGYTTITRSLGGDIAATVDPDTAPDGDVDGGPTNFTDDDSGRSLITAILTDITTWADDAATIDAANPTATSGVLQATTANPADDTDRYLVTWIPMEVTTANDALTVYASARTFAYATTDDMPVEWVPTATGGFALVGRRFDNRGNRITADSIDFIDDLTTGDYVVDVAPVTVDDIHDAIERGTSTIDDKITPIGLQRFDLVGHGLVTFTYDVFTDASDQPVGYTWSVERDGEIIAGSHDVDMPTGRPSQLCVSCDAADIATAVLSALREAFTEAEDATRGFRPDGSDNE